ncbi:hypothetical protein [Vibrio phage RYC]|nr:hypothetical protein [Vibrio phage RYC]
MKSFKEANKEVVSSFKKDLRRLDITLYDVVSYILLAMIFLSFLAGLVGLSLMIAGEGVKFFLVGVCSTFLFLYLDKLWDAMHGREGF